jgi:diacylglycerol O-acyltransferase
VQIFQMPDDAPEGYMNDLVTALKEAKVEPPFNYRPHFPRIGLPEWQVDEHMDIDYHVRHSALPAPGSNEQLMEVLSRLHCGVLNRDRPGWICQIIEGLEGNRFAIYSKIHHAYVDGMSGVKRLFGSLSTSPDSMRVVPSWSYVAKKKAASARAPLNPIGKVKATSEAVLGQAKAVGELYAGVAKTGLQFLNLREGKARAIFNAPRTRMNHRVEYDTRAIATCTLSLAQIMAVAKASGGKVNDVVLTVIDAALQDYLAAHKEQTDKPLVALCPMSLRAEGDDAATTKATILHIGMGSPDADVTERLHEIIGSSRASKEEAESLSQEALMDAAILLFGSFELIQRTGASRIISPSFNLVVSNVPGPRQTPLYLCGAKQLASYPISAFLPGASLNVTVLSHGKQMDFGLVADKRALPDLQFVARRVEQRFAELVEEVLQKNSSASKAKPRKKAATSRAKATKSKSAKSAASN